MRWPARLLVAQLLLLGLLAGLVVTTGDLPFGREDTAGRPSPVPTRHRFDERRAFALLRMQVALGPRPAGSPASRRLAGRLRHLLPRGRYEPVPGGLRNVVGVVRGRSRRLVLLGAHYDTKDLPGFLGANDGGAATAVVTELARSLRPRELEPTVAFLLFHGEDSPRGTPDSEFTSRGLLGSRAAVTRYRHARAMVLLDFIGQRGVRLPRERFSSRALWRKLRAAARRTGTLRAFPPETGPIVADDHWPFGQAGVPAIDLIDFDYPCFHRRCDDLSAVSQRSLDVVGETVRELLARL